MATGIFSKKNRRGQKGIQGSTRGAKDGTQLYKHIQTIETVVFHLSRLNMKKGKKTIKKIYIHIIRLKINIYIYR